MSLGLKLTATQTETQLWFISLILTKLKEKTKSGTVTRNK